LVKILKCIKKRYFRINKFDLDKLDLTAISYRCNDLDLTIIKPLKALINIHDNLNKIADKIIAARKNNVPIILMIGAHVLRSGVQRYIIDMI